MINFKKMDDEDFVFLNETSYENDKAFSDFLKNRNRRVDMPQISFTRKEIFAYA